MKNAFVTGGSGFLGLHLIPQLIEKGFAVRALARSANAAHKISDLGATPVSGDISEKEILEAAVKGATHVFHAAARFADWGSYSDFYETNVVGTERLLDAAKKSGTVTKFIYVGASAVVMGKDPVHDADETWPLQYPDYSPYIKTKALAEDRVSKANAPDFKTVTIRPGWIWGPGDHSISVLESAAKKNQLVWINQGRYAYVTSHVVNVCHAILLAAENDEASGIYFVTDEEPVIFRQWVTQLLSTRGLTPKNTSLPYGLAWAAASAIEGIWSKCGLRKNPPLTRTTLRMIGQEFTVSNAKARRELGYAPIMSREMGLSELQ